MKLLHELVESAACQAGNAVAVRGPDGSFTYRQLDRWSNRIARELQRCGVSRGDRVALWGDKSCRMVAAMQACLRIGAAYVPVATHVPVARAQQIFDDCNVRCVAVDACRRKSLLGSSGRLAYVCLDDLEQICAQSSGPLERQTLSADELAYILYTSGSTGQPKGVCVSHRSAIAFVRWASKTSGIHRNSRLANLAAFSFDLSVFDLYVTFLCRASVSLVPEHLTCSPAGMVDFIAREAVTVIDSVPSGLVLMMEQGGLLERIDLSVTTIVFGGEVFPIDKLRRLRKWRSELRLLNFYGPTETNVCACYEVHRIDPNRTEPVPIGRAACGNRIWLGDSNGRAVESQEGELFVEGPTVMLGYWGREPLHDRRYATGDICRIDREGNFVFVGRKDQRVKIRGYRVELGEVEAVLRTYPGLTDVAVTVVGEGVTARLAAFFVASKHCVVTLVRLKQHCAKHLPAHMTVSLARPLKEIPRTPNGKVDRLQIHKMAESMSQAPRRP